MELNKYSQVLCLLFVVAFAFWVFSVVTSGHSASDLGYFTQIPLAAIPLLGGVFGLFTAKKWGMWQSLVGKSVVLISLGILAWSGGMILWNVYIFLLKVEVPYPSLADAVFVFCWVLWPVGVGYLGKVIGVKFGVRDVRGKFQLLIIPIIMAIVSYYFLFVQARGGSIVWDNQSAPLIAILKLFFDFFYPIGTSVISTVVLITYLLSRDYLGGVLKKPILVLFAGFMLNSLGDFIFTYTTTRKTYFNGHVADMIYTTAMFCLSLAVVNLVPKKNI